MSREKPICKECQVTKKLKRCRCDFSKIARENQKALKVKLEDIKKLSDSLRELRLPTHH